MSSLFKVIFCRFHRGKSPFKPPFGEYFLFFSNHLKQKWSCFRRTYSDEIVTSRYVTQRTSLFFWEKWGTFRLVKYYSSIQQIYTYTYIYMYIICIYIWYTGHYQTFTKKEQYIYIYIWMLLIYKHFHKPRSPFPYHLQMSNVHLLGGAGIAGVWLKSLVAGGRWWPSKMPLFVRQALKLLSLGTWREYCGVSWGSGKSAATPI